ncbi:MAG: DUF1893 domain-containing protein [Clostridium sp.]|nr:DUF1893 domain-containing protein [Clostridium sp.]MCM1547805.1 DUF1893 domain-containing protein [Ruminococcus sp.]
MNDLEKAKNLLNEDEFTLVAVNRDWIITRRERCIKPLIDLYDSGAFLNGFSVADKVVGKAAAFMYALLKPNEIYAPVISRQALTVLNNYSICIHYDTVADSIRNYDDTDSCPLEAVVRYITDPKEALTLIRKRMKELNIK